jgi:putative nucleotidyltransferase with HDIG domain
MIKKIKTEQLRPGMFIHDLCCSWLEHSFVKGQLRVRNEKMVEKIIGLGIPEVYIETNGGLEIIGDLKKEEGRPETHSLFTRVAEDEPGALRHAFQEDGFDAAKKINESTREVVQKIIADTKSNRPDIRQVLQRHMDRETEGVEQNDSVPIQEEVVEAAKIKSEAKEVVHKIMENARLGRQIEMEEADHLVEKMIDSIFRNKDALNILLALKRVDNYTFMHSLSVCALAVSFCRSLFLNRNVIRQIGVGALLHDIGKVKVSSEILNKAGKLSDFEDAKFKEHVAHSCVVLSKASKITPVSLLVVAEHHEHYDGTGYPRGLHGDEISAYAQLVAIVNMYDVLTSKNGNRTLMEPTMAVGKLFEQGNILFDEALVKRFIRCIGIYPVGALVRLESGLLGVVVEHKSKELLNPTVKVVYDTNKELFVKPYDIDLSKSEGTAGGDQIVGYESPHKRGINPRKYVV